MSRVRMTSRLSRFSWIRCKALSRLSQKLISCSAVPDEGSLSNLVTYFMPENYRCNLRITDELSDTLLVDFIVESCDQIFGFGLGVILWQQHGGCFEDVVSEGCEVHQGHILGLRKIYKCLSQPFLTDIDIHVKRLHSPAPRVYCGCLFFYHSLLTQER
ncbi:hypothetical protein HUJ04_004795 [Dendroctonus ponderosae]|nr:hypothetical protein HUJ04_004795 [Dendroctonus ponderosae]